MTTPTDDDKAEPSPLDPKLERYLLLCQRIAARMKAEGNWPWADDTIEQPHDYS